MNMTANPRFTRKMTAAAVAAAHAPELDGQECECLVYVAELRVDENWRGQQP